MKKYTATFKYSTNEPPTEDIINKPLTIEGGSYFRAADDDSARAVAFRATELSSCGRELVVRLCEISDSGEIIRKVACVIAIISILMQVLE